MEMKGCRENDSPIKTPRRGGRKRRKPFERGAFRPLSCLRGEMWNSVGMEHSGASRLGGVYLNFHQCMEIDTCKTRESSLSPHFISSYQPWKKRQY